MAMHIIKTPFKLMLITGMIRLYLHTIHFIFAPSKNLKKNIFVMIRRFMIGIMHNVGMVPMVVYKVHIDSFKPQEAIQSYSYLWE